MSEQITKEVITNLANENQIIALIKLYREKTNNSLLDSKQAVERCRNHLSNQFNIPALLKLFFPSAPPVPLSPELLAMKHLEKHWRILGFQSIKHAMLSILQNF